MELTAKERRFVEEFLVDLNATQAAIRAGYSEKTANQQATQIMARPRVQEAIAAARAAQAKRTQIDADYVLRQAVKLHERCMQEIKPYTDRKGEQIYDEDGNALFVFNANGAAKALELIGKHVGVQAFREQVGLGGLDGGPVKTIAEIRRVIVRPGDPNP